MISRDDPRLERLRTVVRNAAAASPFYARKFAGCDLDAWTSLPFTTKAELVADQAANPPYGTVLTLPRSRYTRVHQTSGTSSGRPLRWLDTPQSWSWLLDCWDEIYDLAGIRADDVILFPFSFGPFLGFWTAFESAVRRGLRVLPVGGLSSLARLHYLLDHQATVVCCTPTYGLHLAELAAREGIDLAASPVRLLIVAGEPGGGIPATRERLERGWGARVIDHYGMTEMGPAAVEPFHEPGSLRVLPDQFVAEVIRPEGEDPVDDGEIGELVLTNLGRSGSPLIRYRTGDLVRGRRSATGLLLEGGILGRMDDMLHIRGNNVYPAAVEAVIHRFPEIATYRLVVDRCGPLPDLVVEVEPSGRREGLAAAVAQALRDAFLFRIPVIEVAPGSLPRYEMKARRVVDRREIATTKVNTHLESVGEVGHRSSPE